MLKAIVLQLKPTDKAKLPRSHGGFAYAAALDLIMRHDVKLSQKIHDGKSHKPITVSQIFGNFQKDQHDQITDPDQFYRWRLTSLDQEASAVFDQIIGDFSPIRFGDAIFRLTDVFTEPDQDSDCGQIGYDELWQKCFSRENPPRFFDLKLITPTTFRTQKFETPFPTPDLFFGSLIRSWGRYSTWDVREMIDFIGDRIALSNWRGETHRVEFGKRKTVGCVGKFGYRVIGNAPEICRLIGLLIEFGFYSGVGWQTTSGLGKMRPEFTAN